MLVLSLYADKQRDYDKMECLKLVKKKKQCSVDMKLSSQLEEEKIPFGFVQVTLYRVHNERVIKP